MSNKAVSNERIIAALLQHGTIKAAAAEAGISQRALYERMQDRDFRAAYTDARAAIVRDAVNALSNKLSAAVDTIADIMTDEKASPGIRLQAAQMVLTNATKFIDRLNAQEAASRDLRDPTELFI